MTLRSSGVPRRGPGQPRKHPAPSKRACEHCGTIFTPRDPRNPGRFHNRGCADEAKAVYPAPEPRPCAHCGETFKPARNEIDRKYCKTKCHHAAMSKYPQPEPRACANPNCGETFTPDHPSSAVNGEGIYCSDFCRDTAPQRRAKISAALRERWRVGEIGLGFLAHWGPRARQRWKGRWGGRKTPSPGAAPRGRPRVDLPPEQVERIRHLHELGYGRRSIKEHVGISERVVRLILSRYRDA